MKEGSKGFFFFFMIILFVEEERKHDTTWVLYFREASSEGA